DAGVVDEHVQLAVRLHGRGHGRSPVLLASHVQMHVGRVAPRSADLRLELLAVVVEDVAEDDARAFPDEHPCLGRALPTRPAADQCHLAVKSSHGCLLRIDLWPCESLQPALLYSATCLVEMHQRPRRAAARFRLALSWPGSSRSASSNSATLGSTSPFANSATPRLLCAAGSLGRAFTSFRNNSIALSSLSCFRSKYPSCARICPASSNLPRWARMAPSVAYASPQSGRSRSVVRASRSASSSLPCSSNSAARLWWAIGTDGSRNVTYDQRVSESCQIRVCLQESVPRAAI